MVDDEKGLFEILKFISKSGIEIFFEILVIKLIFSVFLFIVIKILCFFFLFNDIEKDVNFIAFFARLFFEGIHYVGSYDFNFFVWFTIIFLLAFNFFFFWLIFYIKFVKIPRDEAMEKAFIKGFQDSILKELKEMFPWL